MGLYVLVDLERIPVNTIINYLSAGCIPVEEYEKLLEHPSEMVRHWIAESPKTLEKALIKLARDSSDMVKRAAASNKKMPTEGIDILADDPNEAIRALAVTSKNISKEKLEELVIVKKEKSIKVKCGIALNPKTTIGVQSILVRDVAEVKRCLATRPNLAQEFIKILIKDDDSGVRAALTSQQNITFAQLDDLSKDKSEIVKVQVAQSVKLLERTIRFLAKDPSVLVKSKVVANPIVPRDVVEEILLYNANEVIILAAIAANPKIEDDILSNILNIIESLQKLSTYDYLIILNRIKENPNASKQTLKKAKKMKNNMN